MITYSSRQSDKINVWYTIYNDVKESTYYAITVLNQQLFENDCSFHFLCEQLNLHSSNDNLIILKKVLILMLTLYWYHLLTYVTFSINYNALIGLTLILTITNILTKNDFNNYNIVTLYICIYFFL